MDKLTIVSMIIWVVFAIIMVVGQFCGASVFFVICNDIFAGLNCLMILGLVPQLFMEIKNKRKNKKLN